MKLLKAIFDGGETTALSARALTLEELHSASGRRLVLLLVRIDPNESPPREDFLAAAAAAAARYQY